MCGVCMWCLCVVFVCGVCVWVFVWRLCGVCVAFVWRLCGVCVVFVWCLCGWDGEMPHDT